MVQETGGEYSSHIQEIRHEAHGYAMHKKKEEKAHDERIAASNTKIKQAGSLLFLSRLTLCHILLEDIA